MGIAAFRLPSFIRISSSFPKLGQSIVEVAERTLEDWIS